MRAIYFSEVKLVIGLSIALVASIVASGILFCLVQRATTGRLEAEEARNFAETDLLEAEIQAFVLTAQQQDLLRAIASGQTQSVEFHILFGSPVPTTPRPWLSPKDVESDSPKRDISF